MDAFPSRSRDEWLTAAGLFFSALALRLAHLRQIAANDPFFYLPSVDPRIYHDWAVELSRGGWIGDEVFLLGPLYPYFLGLVYAAVGPNILAAKLIHCLIGSATCVLVWMLAREVFDRRVALLAGAMTAVYSMLIFYEGSLMITNLQTPLVLLVLITAVKGLRAPTPGRWFLAGALLGLAALARENVLLYAPIAVFWILWQLRAPLGWKGAVAVAAAFCAGAALPVGTATVRNYAVSGEPALIVAGGGAQFYTGNNPDADGTYRIPKIFPRHLADHPFKERAIYRDHAERRTGRTLRESEVSAFWVGEGLGFIRAQPIAWVRLLARKFLLFWNAEEIWNNRSYTLSRSSSLVLRLPLLGFGVVAPLALLGIALSAGDWRRLFPLHAMVGVFLATALIFFVLSRFRTPVVPVLIVFAASGALALWDAARAGKIRRLAAALLALALFALLVHLPLVEENLSMAHYNLANRYKAMEKWDLAIAEYWKSLERDASYLPAYNNLALAYEGTGSNDREAIVTWERVLELAEKRGLEREREVATRHLHELRARGGELGDGAEPDRTTGRAGRARSSPRPD
jgi:4-amino-4-deoxy-L-arabinose transferase-like glycosyltransferase